MLQDAHSRKISIPVTAGPGPTIVIPAVPEHWIYVHTLIGDLSAAGSLDILSGATVLANFNLAAGQGITETDEPGEDNRPRFECPPGEDFILDVTGAVFTGAVHYSLRN
jgi:hypothetical protein